MTQMHLINGKQVSRLAFGTMQFGGTADASESRALYDLCRATGITHFDTAVRYTDGASERLLGPMVSAEREDVFVATKVGYSGGAGRANIMEQWGWSRDQLRLDTVDLLYMHRFDPDTDLEETFSTLAELQQSGAVRYIGVSNYAAWQVMKAQAVAAALGTRIDAIQPMYNLVKRQAEVEIIPMACDQDIAIIPYSPLGGGLLTGKYAAGGAGRIRDNKMYAARYAQDWMHDAAAALSRIAKDENVDPATLAVAWIMHQPGDIMPILSARSVAQLKPSLAAANFEMSHELLARITALSPTPPPATDRLEEA
ncbi:Predicted oxidoreductase [Cognatiyoonia koreensis]|uniref:Predicted oxidoreductase n=1 Tax=Cognatiyoonia koreensis TaxID=364200 RepID=A0A1I0QJX6_9RHOB|nr:aldo/keto reductase [Cognatiyoonia koreensis]SEW27336.1 Predicted oxidoreductase [Cognatiyoonia koreensis]